MLGYVVDYGEEVVNLNVRCYCISGNIDFYCDVVDVVGFLCLYEVKSGG